ncbi:uncharacterized protein LOC113353844 isoform X1 [Papaver somniferum]|uniref:uncharacterized protein LOC113353844 isoform X1 n=1 Tax=Papaver somniferum TaxID=3469 RepID=UPI000E705287|nr:uncharacterized protein LOC113353844 isoform X1 [Papaver somniferum]
MAISVFLKPFTLRAQLPSSLSLCGSVFRNVNHPRTRSLLSTQFRSLGSRAYCSKADHSDPVAQEILTEGDKQVLDIIVSELKRNGFDFTKDPVTLQKIEEAVERTVTRMTNKIKLDMPVPAGEPEMSALISWGKYSGPPALELFILVPTKIAIRLRDPLNCSCSK